MPDSTHDERPVDLRSPFPGMAEARVGRLVHAPQGSQLALRALDAMASPTLRTLSGLPAEPGALKDSALVIIDAQQTYREGVMKPPGRDFASEAGKCRFGRRFGQKIGWFHHCFAC